MWLFGLHPGRAHTVDVQLLWIRLRNPTNSIPVNTTLLCRLTIIGGLLAAAAVGARAQAQLGGEGEDQGPNGVTVAKPVVEVRGETAYIEVDGKMVAVKPNRITFYPSNGPFRLYAKDPPQWVFASRLEAGHVESVRESPVHPAHSELRFSVELQATAVIEKAWILITLIDNSVVRKTYVSNLGTLRPYKLKRVDIRNTLNRDLDDPIVDWHIFSQGREVLHSLMPNDALGRAVGGMIAQVREGVRNADVAPYLTFPPRNLAAVNAPVTLRFSVDAKGWVSEVSVVDGAAAGSGADLRDAARLWWFLPRRVNGHNFPCVATVRIDPTQTTPWSNKCVVVQESAPPKPAAP